MRGRHRLRHKRKVKGKHSKMQEHNRETREQWMDRLLRSKGLGLVRDNFQHRINRRNNKEEIRLPCNSSSHNSLPRSKHNLKHNPSPNRDLINHRFQNTSSIMSTTSHTIYHLNFLSEAMKLSNTRPSKDKSW